MSHILTRDSVMPLIKMALDEDISTGDVTSIAIFDGSEISSAYIIAKQDGIVCGTDLVKWVYEEIDQKVKVHVEIADGSHVKKGDVAIRVNGFTKSILEGERTALNFFQRMSGIATKTKDIVRLVEGTKIKILDTRKTLPGFRMMDKYSVKTGGGENHRIGLYDMVLIKDNHIRAAGSIATAVEKVRKQWKDAFRVEVETTTLDEVKEALASGADIIMLDNMDKPMMQEACEIIAGRAKIELSGNMDADRICNLRDLDIDFISIGSLTHSVEAFDWSMKFL